jgi:hypothetical protein
MDTVRIQEALFHRIRIHKQKQKMLTMFCQVMASGSGSVLPIRLRIRESKSMRIHADPGSGILLGRCGTGTSPGAKTRLIEK